jgi:hypothetical protein
MRASVFLFISHLRFCLNCTALNTEIRVRKPAHEERVVERAADKVLGVFPGMDSEMRKETS